MHTSCELGKESTQQKWSSILAKSDHRISSSGSSAKKQNRGTFQGYAPSYMETSNILSHRHVPLCFDRDFPVFYDIVLFHFTQIHFFFWPHASVCNAQCPWWQTTNLPLFWTCHLLASFHVSEISQETETLYKNTHCSPFPCRLCIYRPAYIHCSAVSFMDVESRFI